MKDSTFLLKRVYKAAQCTDMNDLETAIQSVKDIAGGNYTPALRRRLASLQSKKAKLCQSSTK